MEQVRRKRWGNETRKRAAACLGVAGLGTICSVSRSEMGSVQAVEKKNGWERVRVQVDSGAIDSVAPKAVAAGLPVRVTKAAKAGLGYVAANGSRIENYAERVIRGTMDDGESAAMAFQISDVKRPLGSVFRMNQAGTKAVLDGKESYTIRKPTGRVTRV